MERKYSRSWWRHWHSSETQNRTPNLIEWEVSHQETKPSNMDGIVVAIWENIINRVAKKKSAVWTSHGFLLPLCCFLLVSDGVHIRIPTTRNIPWLQWTMSNYLCYSNVLSQSTEQRWLKSSKKWYETSVQDTKTNQKFRSLYSRSPLHE
jgi:hypothetical protein